jgi:hypothetical protein
LFCLVHFVLQHWCIGQLSPVSQHLNSINQFISRRAQQVDTFHQSNHRERGSFFNFGMWTDTTR